MIEEFSSSPDGVIREDLLADLQPSSQSLDGSSGKFSGDGIADFDPRHCKQVQLIISDRVGAEIALRNIQFSQRKVSPSGQVQSQQINQPLGNVVFRAAQHTADKLTSITHQVSTDNIHYQSVAPGQVLALAVPYWYRGILTRLDANFDQAAAPVDMPGTDPSLNPAYTLQSTATTDLGGGIIERTLNFSAISGPVQLEETPLDGTLVVFNGTVPVSATLYSMVGNLITFTAPQAGIMVRYQTSAFARAGLPARKDLLQSASIRSPVRTALISRYNRSKVKYSFISCFITSPPPILSASAKLMRWTSQILEIRKGGRRGFTRSLGPLPTFSVPP